MKIETGCNVRNWALPLSIGWITGKSMDGGFWMEFWIQVLCVYIDFEIGDD